MDIHIQLDEKIFFIFSGKGDFLRDTRKTTGCLSGM